jgi:hypothetical protein
MDIAQDYDLTVACLGRQAQRRTQCTPQQQKTGGAGAFVECPHDGISFFWLLCGVSVARS